MTGINPFLLEKKKTNSIQVAAAQRQLKYKFNTDTTTTTTKHRSATYERTHMHTVTRSVCIDWLCRKLQRFIDISPQLIESIPIEFRWEFSFWVLHQSDSTNTNHDTCEKGTKKSLNFVSHYTKFCACFFFLVRVCVCHSCFQNIPVVQHIHISTFWLRNSLLNRNVERI